jgi:hypothetical protein
MGHRKSIVREAIERLDSLMAIGESRFQVKQAKRAASPEAGWTVSTGKMHSHTTRRVYQQHMLAFINWARTNHGITRLAWLDERADELATAGTAPHGGGQFGQLSHSLDSRGDSPYPSLSRWRSPVSLFQTARIVMALHAFVFLLVVCLLLSLARLGRLCWFPLRLSSSRGGAKRTTLHRLLKPRSPDDCPACRLASTPSSSAGPAPAPVRPWSEVKSRRGARHPREHRGLCLSQPAVLLLRDHRCPRPRSGRRWQAWPGRAHPDVSLSSLPHHVQCST